MRPQFSCLTLLVTLFLLGLGRAEPSAQELEKIGAPALEALQRAAKSDDLETRGAAEELVARVQVSNLAATMLAPRKVSLDLKEVPVAEALAQVNQGIEINANRVAHQVTLVYRPGAGQKEPARLVLRGQQLVVFEVPFTLKNIPLRTDAKPTSRKGQSSCSPLPCTRGRGVGGEGVAADHHTVQPPHPRPLSPEYRGEGRKKGSPLRELVPESVRNTSGDLLALLPPTRQADAQENKLDPAATRDYAVAAGLQNKQLHAQAIRRWQKFIQTYPNDPRLANAHNHLGTCQLQDGKYTEAVATFRTVLSKFPKFESLDATHFNLGLALYNIGQASKKASDLQAAGQAFAEVPARFAGSKHAPAALYYQAECLYQAGSLADAAVAYQKVIATYPDSHLLPDVYFALGATQQELGKDKEAAGTFSTFLQKFPKDRQGGECRLRLGQSLFKQKLYAEAMPVFAQAAALPDFPDADFALMQQAHCLYEQNQFAQAAGLYEGLVRKFPKSTHVALAQLSAGKCWYQAGNYAQAQTALAAVDPKSAEAAESACWLGQALTRSNRSAEALVVLEKAMAVHPQSGFLPQLTLARAAALYEQPARRKEAAAAYAGFARKHPQHPQAPRAGYLAALAALKLEDYQAARSLAEAFLADRKLDKHELVPDVLFIAAESQVQSDKPDLARAEALYRRLLTEYPRHAHAPQASLRIGLCLHLARKHTEAVAHLTQALVGLKDPTLAAEAHFLIGRAHQDAGRVAEAGIAFQKALQAKADWQRGDEVLLALAQAQRRRSSRPRPATSSSACPLSFQQVPSVPRLSTNWVRSPLSRASTMRP